MSIQFPFFLQLDPNKNLTDQCVAGDGLVQINLQVQFPSKRINIIDVLKPSDEVLETYQRNAKNFDSSPVQDESQEEENRNSTKNSPKTPNSTNLKWMVDYNFKNDQISKQIPDDPVQWNVQQVKYWLQWAIKQFKMNSFKLNEWNISGKELCDLTYKEFKAKVPSDSLDIFWMHFEFLRKHKYVAILEDSDLIEEIPNAVSKKTQKPIMQVGVDNRSGNNGQIQLWQFLLGNLSGNS